METSAEPELIELGRQHRDVMLDLVLVWASIDGALSMLLANVRGIPWPDAADDIRKLRGSAKINAVVETLKAIKDGDDAARKLRKIKKRYERYSDLRDHIAHSRCIGANKLDPNMVVFLTFERVGDDHLAMYQVPLEKFREAHDWGQDFLSLLFRWTRGQT